MRLEAEASRRHQKEQRRSVTSWSEGAPGARQGQSDVAQ